MSRFLRRLTTRLVAPSAVSLGILAGTMPVSAGGPLATFNLYYGSCSVSGIGPSKVTIKVTWKDGEGALKQVHTLKSRANGSFETRCDYDEMLEKGDVLTVKVGTRTRSITVPRLSINIDRVADTISGRGPANSSVLVFGQEGPTGPDGSYLFDLSSDTDINGIGFWDVTWLSPSGDVVTRDAPTPGAHVVRGRPDIWMRGRPGANLVAELLDGSLAERATARCQSGQSGECWTEFRDDEGHPVRPATGDTVRALGVASDLEFLIPAVDVAAVTGTDVISGTCKSALFYKVFAWHPQYEDDVSKSGTAGANGAFSRDVTPTFDVRFGDKLELACEMTSGDSIGRFETVP